ncbi:thioredoxin family protein [Alkalinema sp. FACHB-956]|uniref:TlpA family protein disulfide reductase n=1 Tax=Alkalinema sp. FACHB-956 TaxID=2692768 RepID=UPI0016856A6C|nr:thioredoxin family protein [Alkalinema sp. FACHB-956]MBD2329306.1 thioredoxin family protein [Alkalinema sp. FACHB-956]
MRQNSGLWLSLGLSSLVVTVSLVAVTTALPSPAIAQTLRSAKQGNVGGSLAKQLHGKPVVVDIYASWCPACSNIAPTLSQLKKEYAGKVHFVVLDVSDKSKTRQAEAQAKQLGLGQFFNANKSQTGTVTIIDPATGNILAQHRNNPNKSVYTAVLNAAISQR